MTDAGCANLDCDDTDEYVNPAMPELLSTPDVDEDCDGSFHIRQLLEAGMANGGYWNATNVTWPAHIADLAPTAGNPASIALKSDFDWEHGLLHVTVGVKRHDLGASCTVDVTTDTDSDSQSLPTAFPSEHTVALDLEPPFTVEDLEIVRSHQAGSNQHVEIDYVTVTNGDYQWAHPRDQQVAYEATGFPGGGYGGPVVRTDDSGTYLILATNTGGVAISDDGHEWTYIGGDDVDDRSKELIKSWEVWSADGSSVYALSGDEQADYGGLLKWSASTDTWDVLDAELAVDDNDHICSDDHHAGGRLMTAWDDGTTDVLLLANHSDTFTDAGDTADLWDLPGVFAFDAGSDSYCAADGLLDLPSGSDDELVSSVAIFSLSTRDYLVVGYKAREDLGDSLWVCPLDGTCSAGVTSGCTAVTDATEDTDWDIRDLAVQLDPDNERALVYLADAGLREDADACTREAEGSVHVVEFAEGAAWEWNSAVWDSDTTYSGDCDRSTNRTACPQGWHDTGDTGLLDEYLEKVFETDMMGSGELRVPEGDTTSTNELVGLALQTDDAGETWLFAFSKLSGQAYRYPKIHRAKVTTPPGEDELLAWKPLQDFSSTDELWDLDTTIDSNYEQRANTGDDGGSWLRALHVQDDREGWFPRAPIDAVFYDQGGEGVVAMVSGDFGVYALPEESATEPGWDTPYDSSYDLDELPWSWALSPAGDMGQLVGRDLEFCSSCEPSTVDANGLAVVASYDVAMNWLYGPKDGGGRVAGLHDCHVEHMQGGGAAVAMVEGEGTATFWLVRRQEATGEPKKQNLLKGVLASGDDFEDGDWCYETIADYKSNDPFNGDNAVCPRDDVMPGDYDWPACDPGGTPGSRGQLLENGGSPFGSPTDVDVLQSNADVAVVSFASYAGSVDYAGGLAVFYPDGTDMAVYDVDYAAPADTSCATSSYDEGDVFDHTGSRLAIDQARSSWSSATSFDLWVYVSAAGYGATAGDDCAIYEVNLTYSSGVTATWTPIDIGSALTGDCSDLTVDDVHGVASAPWAPGTVWVFGDTAGTGALCQIDISETSHPGASTWTGLAKDDGKDRQVKRVRAHPHLEDTLLVGTAMPFSTNPWRDYELPGLYQVSSRLNGAFGDMRTEWRRIPAEGLSNPNLNGIAFDVVEASDPYSIEAFWVSSSGSGVYEGVRTWQYD